MVKKRKSFSKAKKTNKKEKPKSTGKLRSHKTVVDGIRFDSKMEADYYEYLKEQRAKKILTFELQPEFVLLESYKKYGKTIRGMKYIADFKVEYKDGSELIIDVKGVETADFKIKRKLFDFLYPDKNLKLVIWNYKDKYWADFDEMKKAKRVANKKKKKDIEDKVE